MTTIEVPQLVRWLEGAAALFETHKAMLTELDSAIGDADHGANMARGFAAVVEKLPGLSDKGINGLFKGTAMVLMSKVGGASGMLYSNFFLRAADAAAARQSLAPQELGMVLDAGVKGILDRGRAEPGDKTMVDAWLPALAAFGQALSDGGDLAAALAASTAAARRGMEATIPMLARKGRASYLGERSIGHQDPGATSTVLLLEALAAALTSTPG